MTQGFFLEGDGRYAMPIVGETHYQDVLEDLCGGSLEPTAITAALIPEHDNPHDLNAIRVELEGEKGGYLSRDMAKVYREIMYATRELTEVGSCRAIIQPPYVGGTPPPKLLDRFYVSDTYEVFLDLFDADTMDEILEELAERAVDVTFDPAGAIEFDGIRFCLTGSFSRSRKQLRSAIQDRGGVVADNVSGKIRYLVVGHAGSGEWKYGSHGTKVEKAVRLKEDKGANITIIPEDQLLAALDE